MECKRFIFDSAALELERQARPGRISLLGANVRRLLADLIPLVHAQNSSAADPVRVHRNCWGSIKPREV